MAVMTVGSTSISDPLTIADLEDTPDDGRRYELLDGALIVTPAPTWSHQQTQAELLVRLYKRCPPHLRVLGAPFAVRPGGNSTELQPDILVARYEDLTQKCLPAAPVLAIEVLSPSTSLIDFNLKKTAYERFGSESYWIVDPAEPALFGFEPGANGEYQQIAHVRANEPFHAKQPFAITIVPNELIAGLHST